VILSHRIGFFACPIVLLLLKTAFLLPDHRFAYEPMADAGPHYYHPTRQTMSDSGKPSMALFWGCFAALITTAFGFISRMFLIGEWSTQFGLDPAQAGRLAGIGIWPFAVSIILFSLVIDKIGYKRAMFIACAGHLLWAIMGVSAFFVAEKSTGFALLYWGSLVLGLANGTVEAFINPVVATMFSRDKTKWLNILHAGWPGGLVLAGMITIFMGNADWWIKVGIIAIPAIIYFIMLVGLEFPENERVAAGVSYKEMLKEFGILGMAVVAFLVVLQLMDFFPTINKAIWVAVGVGMLVWFAAYTKSLGRGLLFFLILLMVPLATTEIGTDGWITGIMEGFAKEKNFHPGWILVYTSAIMVVLRFYAGPIVNFFGPLGLLAASAIMAIGGLYFLSFAQGAMVFVAATLYGFGKTFFWPTTLGVVAEQTPKGGALTLNAISGIGMLAVGVLGFPYIGVLQTKTNKEALIQSTEIQAAIPGLVKDGNLTATTEKNIYEVLTYDAIDDAKVAALTASLPEADRAAATAKLTEIKESSSRQALASMAVFPLIMLVSYLILMAYFKSKGGYKPITINSAH
jgi:MFS family permease